MKILIAEDDPVSRRLLESLLLKWGYEVIAVSNGREALQCLLAENAPRLALLDWAMPALDGVELCRNIRARETLHYVYSILITAKSRKEDLILGMEAGADDYIVKPYDPDELRVRLRAARRILDLQDTLLQKQEQLKSLATHDPLTGLLNHVAILDILENELDRSSRGDNPVSVIMADIDHFKGVNDTWGHIAGDAVLRGVAAIIIRSMRKYDSPGRYGGEEFLCVIPGCGLKEALGIARRINAAVAEKPFDTSEGMISTTISLGVAISGAQWKKVSGEELVHLADQAMYRAKDNGRNRVESAQGELA